MKKNPATVFLMSAASLMLWSMLSFAAAPAMRDEVNLAGTWPTGGVVPYTNRDQAAGLYGTDVTRERTVTIPSSWTGKRIFLELEGVNWQDVTSIDGIQVGSSSGGWLPHSYDVTSRVTPGGSHSLRIVSGGSKPNGWPKGFPSEEDRMGAYTFTKHIFDVYLRAYGLVAIRNAEVITSVANKTISVKYEIENFHTIAKTVTIVGKVYPSTGGPSALLLTSNSVTLNAGQKQTVTVSASWQNPNLWWPSDPKLYHLGSAIKESGTTIDSQTVRFGFREMKIAGRYLQLNGIRVNLRGESVEMGNSIPDAAAMSQWLTQREYPVNSNSIRFHVKPVMSQLLDECDERGIFVMLEGAQWQDPGTCGSTQTLNTWIPAWVKHNRNHPSVVHWAAQNECYGLSEAVGNQMIQKIHDNDGSSRPVWHEDVIYSSFPTQCKHYPEQYGNLPNPGMLYNTDWVSQSKPQSAGEMLFIGTSSDNRWWAGIYSRTMRYNDVSVIHNYVYSGWVTNSANSAQTTLLANAYAPVALFDKDYDGLGIAPQKDNILPSLTAGSTVNRTLVLYNDEFSENIVTVQVQINANNSTYASVTKSYLVELGNHITIPCSFQVPYVGGSNLDMVLRTSKAGVQKFSESKRFTATGSSSGTSTNTVTLGGTSVDLTRPFVGLSPSAITTTCEQGTNAAAQTIEVKNLGADNLSAINAHVTYSGQQSGWITLTPSGNGNNQQISVQFTSTSLPVGSWHGQIVVKAAGALPDSAVCPVTLMVSGMRDPDNPPATVQGLNYAYYEASYDILPDLSAVTPLRSGICNGFDLSVATRADNFALSFTGYLQVPANGTYTFSTASDDGSKLYIGSQLVVNNDGKHAVQENSGTIQLKAGLHAIRVDYFESAFDQSLIVKMNGTALSPGALFRADGLSAIRRTIVSPPSKDRAVTMYNIRGQRVSVNNLAHGSLSSNGMMRGRVTGVYLAVDNGSCTRRVTGFAK